MKKVNIHDTDFCDQLLRQIDEIAEQWVINERKEFNEMYYKHTHQGVIENRERKLRRVFGEI